MHDLYDAGDDADHERITVLIVWNGSHAVDEGTMQVGNMMAFMQYAMQIIMAFLMITMMSIMIPRAGVSAKRINEVMETEVSIQDGENHTEPSADRKGEVVFDHVALLIRELMRRQFPISALLRKKERPWPLSEVLEAVRVRW